MKPNIISIICHDMGRMLGCYGHSDVRSPCIDAFSRSGIRFERCFCTAPQCSPSRAALWTGRYPHSTGVLGLTHGGFGHDLNPDERHLAQYLRDNGYETFLEGIQHEARNPERCGFHHVKEESSCNRTADSVCSLLMKHKHIIASPFYLQIGFFEPHRPFPHQGVETKESGSMKVPGYLPDIPEVREDLAEMEASISSVDTAFGKILNTVKTTGLIENTVILFTADHGIPFPHAKMTLYDPGIEVPLIMHVPGIAGGKSYSELISNVDVVPTLLEMLSIEIPSAIEGHSFKRLIRGECFTPRKLVFAEKTYHSYYDPMRAVRTERWKLIANFENTPYQETSPDYDNNAKCYVEVARALGLSGHSLYHTPFELYDLTDDPLEQRNLAQAPCCLAVRNGLICELRQWMSDTKDPLLEGPVPSATYWRRMEYFKDVSRGTGNTCAEPDKTEASFGRHSYTTPACRMDRMGGRK